MKFKIVNKGKGRKRRTLVIKLNSIIVPQKERFLREGGMGRDDRSKESQQMQIKKELTCPSNLYIMI